MPIQNLCRTSRRVVLVMIAAAPLAFISPARADLIDITNSGFEDISGQVVFNEFTFGVPVGWTLYDPENIVDDAGTFTGTLLPNGVDFFNTTAPEGDRVSILFNSGREGEGAYGFDQTLDAQLTAKTRYTLSVEVGNIASGTAQNGQFFNLDEFPGYRVELWAGNERLEMDDNSLVIPEGEFATSEITFTTGSNHDQLGENLMIRLLNLNQLPAGFTQQTSPDLEVDFDHVRLDAAAVPEPSTVGLLSLVGLCLIGRRARRWWQAYALTLKNC